MKHLGKGIEEFEDESSGEIFYNVNYKHRGKIIAKGGPFLTIKEANSFRDSVIDKKNIKKVELTDGQIRYRAEINIRGKKLRKTFSTYRDAVNWRTEKRIKKNVLKGTLGDKMTFGEFSNYWIENEVKVKRADSTIELYERMLRIHILPSLEHLRLDKIKIHHINELMGILKDSNLAVDTMSLIMSVIQRCLEFAVMNDVLMRNIMKSVSKITGQQTEPMYWEIDDLKRFFKYIKKKQCFLMYYTTAKTGMRKGEIAGLKWESVNFKAGMIKCSDTRTNNKFKNETKSKRIRYIPMTGELMSLLKSVSEQLKPKLSDYVFLSSTGKPYSYGSIGPLFHENQHKAQVSKKISFHSLRHTFASHFSMEGGKLELLKEILGHSNFRMTQVYAHHNQEYLKSAKEIIERTEVRDVL